MIPTTTLTMADGVRIVVPDSLDLVTPYVLREQNDWFEDEIKFVRRLLRPGSIVMDIGANYGVYALSMAQAVGSTGQVLAFEPASETANLLAEGIAANGFTQVVLDRSAVSSFSGTAQLALNDSPELNTIVSCLPDSGLTETVPLVTLDECVERYRLWDIDFLKIDAEGEEANILRGGKRFFSELSPLVQYEVKAGTELNMELAETFETLGYRSFRLVPGLNLLASFQSGSAPDPYLLNLFCCKQDRAQQLADRGLLVMSDGHLATTLADGDWEGLKPSVNRSSYGWPHTIAHLPYGAQLSGLWRETVALGGSGEVEEALCWYSVSRDSRLPPYERFGALDTSLGLLKELCHRQPTYLRLASLARVAAEVGERMVAVSTLGVLARAISLHQMADPSEPFLVPCERFEQVSPRDGIIGNWIFAAVLEEMERLESYSSFYSGRSSLKRLQLIHKLGYGSEEMDRRLHLIQLRSGLPAP